MKTTIKSSLFAAAAAILFAGCAYDTPMSNTANTANANANANANIAATTAPPTKEALAALENKAFEAWKNKDGKFFEGFIADNFVGFNEKGERPSRAEVIKMIAESNCDVKSYSLSDERVTPVGADAAVFTAKAAADFTCDGQKGPSPVISSTVYVRSGNEWKAAYHNEVPIVDPKAKMAAAPKPPPPANTATSPATTAPAADALTDTLMALEKRGWEAWKARDAKTHEEILAKDVMFVDLFGNVIPARADIIKAWSEHKCEIRSVNVTDGKAVSITKDAAILTFKGTADGSCEGSPLLPLYGTTVWAKDGDNWKAVYIFETPA